MTAKRAASQKVAGGSGSCSSQSVEEAVRHILDDYKPRPNAPDMSDLMRHLSTKDPAVIEQLLSAMDKETDSVDFDKFDYTKVPVKKNSFWIMQLMPDGFVSPDKTKVSEKYVPGYKPNFSLIIYDENSTFRVAEQPEPGLPSSAFIMQCLKRAIASPMPPLRQSLPCLLIIALKLSPHIDTLRPFLNSLPAPFEWRLETQEEADVVAEGIYEKNQQGVSLGLQSAESEKALGNKAIASKNRDGAVKHYTEAIECLLDARSQNPTDAERKKIMNLLSICHANRAAAWLFDGPGQDPKKALEDADQALVCDENYGKAYYRQAKSHYLLSNKTAAIEALTKALSRPALAQDKGLNDYLIEVYGGFPEDKDELRKFCHDVFKGPDSMRGLKVFEEKANQHVKEVFGPDASIDTV